MSTKPKYASLDPEDMKEGTGLFDNVNAKIAQIQYTKDAPENYQAEGNPIFANVDFLLDGTGPEEERKVSQSFALGASAGDNYDISEDGYGLLPKSDESVLRKDSKWGTFVGSLKTAGVPASVLQAGDASAFIGIYGLFKRIADKERNFSEDQRTRPGQQRKSKFPPSTLCLVKLHAMPGEQPKTAGKTTAAPATTASAPAPAAGGDVDLDTEAWGYVETILKEKGSVQRGGLTLLVSKAAMDNANRSAIAKHAQSEAFIEKMAELGFVTYGKAEKGQPVKLAA